MPSAASLVSTRLSAWTRPGDSFHFLIVARYYFASYFALAPLAVLVAYIANGGLIRDGSCHLIIAATAMAMLLRVPLPTS